MAQALLLNNNGGMMLRRIFNKKYNSGISLGIWVVALMSMLYSPTIFAIDPALKKLISDIDMNGEQILEVSDYFQRNYNGRKTEAGTQRATLLFYCNAHTIATQTLGIKEGCPVSVSTKPIDVPGNFRVAMDRLYKKMSKKQKKTFHKRVIREMIPKKIDRTAIYLDDQFIKSDAYKFTEDGKDIVIKFHHLLGNLKDFFLYYSLYYSSSLKRAEHLRDMRLVLDLRDVKHADLRNVVFFASQLGDLDRMINKKLVETKYVGRGNNGQTYSIQMSVGFDEKKVLELFIKNSSNTISSIELPKFIRLFAGLPIKIMVNKNTGGYAELLVELLKVIKSKVTVTGESSNTISLKSSREVHGGALYFSAGKIFITDGSQLVEIKY